MSINANFEKYCNSLLLLMALFNSCSIDINKSIYRRNVDVQFNQIGSINIPIDDNSSTFWKNTQYVENINGGSYIAYIDRISSDPDYIIFAPINEGHQAFKLTVKLSGPNGVGKLDGFYYINKDSLLVLNSYQYRLYLLNGNGEILSQYFLLNGSKADENSSLPWVTNSRPMHFYENKVYIPAFPDLDPFKINYENERLLIVVDLETKMFEYQIGYPDSYKGKYWGHFHCLPSFTWLDSQMVVSYPIESKLSIKMLNNHNHDWIDVPSQHIWEYSPMNEYSNNREDVLKIQLGSDQYYSILFDKFRNVYYRFCIKKYDDESIKNMINRKIGNPPQSFILIMDKEFNQLREFQLPKGKYIVENSIVIKEGLLIQQDNEDEDSLVYDLYEIDFN